MEVHNVLNEKGRSIKHLSQKKAIIARKLLGEDASSKLINKDTIGKALKHLQSKGKLHKYKGKWKVNTIVDNLLAYVAPEYRRSNDDLKGYNEHSKWHDEQKKIAKTIKKKHEERMPEERMPEERMPEERMPEERMPEERMPEPFPQVLRANFPKNYKTRLDKMWKAATNEEEFPKDEYLRLAREQENLKDYSDDDLVKLFLANIDKRYATNTTKPVFKELRKSMNKVWDDLNDCCGANIPQFFSLDSDKLNKKTKKVLSDIEKSQIIKKAADDIEHRGKIGEQSLSEIAEKTYAKHEPITRPLDPYFDKFEKDAESYIASMKDNDPIEHGKWTKIKQENPQYYEYLLNKIAKKMYNINQMHNNPQMNRLRDINLLRLFYEKNRKKREKIEDMIDEMNGILKEKKKPAHNSIHHDSGKHGEFLHKLIMKHNTMKERAENLTRTDDEGPPLRKVMIK